jgi:hypothetical protein
MYVSKEYGHILVKERKLVSTMACSNAFDLYYEGAQIKSSPDTIYPDCNLSCVFLILMGKFQAITLN